MTPGYADPMLWPLRFQSPTLSRPLARANRQSPQDLSTAPSDQVCLSAAPTSSRPSIGVRAGQALLIGCSLVGGVVGLASAAQAQQVQVRRGVRYDMTEQQLSERLRNSLTADQIGEGQPHFTAWEVDSNQSSKWYHNPRTLQVDEQHSGRTVTEGDPFRQCARQSADGTCQSAKPNQIRYSVLSCIYQKQEDGQLYRVTHRSYQHNYTHNMQRNVCGGHELRYDASAMTYMPHQVNAEGDQLFLNPANILSIEKVGG